jgi:hypothetical protein
MPEHQDEPSPDGLVISDKKGREELFEPRFVSAEKLETASSALPSLPEREESDVSARYSVELSPGSVRVSRHSPKRQTPSPNYRPKSAISSWSRKSRSSMVSRLCSLDYSQMLGDASKLGAMITLTYPRDWQNLAPNGAIAKNHLRLFQKRYARQFGAPLVGIWKMEFQRRGAPHFHIFCVPPIGVDFRRWLSETWTNIVAPPDPTERQKHLNAGTGLDYEQGLRSYDPKRVAVYFSKHASAGFGEKEYQNQPPELWKESGKIGRFWGYWGLRPLVLAVEVSDEDALFVARVLRRWAKANSQPRRIVVWRADTKTGEIRKRHAHRRITRMSGRAGFVSVNDGSAIGEALAQALTACRR